jgi:hypothetical protein
MPAHVLATITPRSEVALHGPLDSRTNGQVELAPMADAFTVATLPRVRRCHTVINVDCDVVTLTADRRNMLPLYQ